MDGEATLVVLVCVVTGNGRVTLPAEVGEALGLKPGDRVAFEISAEREVTLWRVRSVADMTFGSFTPRKRPEDFRELRCLAEDEMAEQASKEGWPEAPPNPAPS